MTQCRILLADDDPQVRLYLQAILKANYIVDQATDGIEALDAVKALGSRVDLLITDIKMPRMDGVELARAVAQLFPMMPVLFISGWADAFEEPEWQQPKYSFLRKPFLPKVLVNSVEELLRRSSARAAASAAISVS
jgi:two-component system cell cycle sensor histidine kinase/response regulator CckA